jgi:hemerythrin
MRPTATLVASCTQAFIDSFPKRHLDRNEWDAAQIQIDETFCELCRIFIHDDDEQFDLIALCRRLGELGSLLRRRFTDEERLLETDAPHQLSVHRSHHRAILEALHAFRNSIRTPAVLTQRFDAAHELRLMVTMHFGWDDSIYRDLIVVRA